MHPESKTTTNRKGKLLRRVLRRLKKKRESKARQSTSAGSEGSERNHAAVAARESTRQVSCILKGEQEDRTKCTYDEYNSKEEDHDDCDSVALSCATAPNPRSAWRATRSFFGSFRAKKQGTCADALDFGFPDSYDEYRDMVDNTSLSSSRHSIMDDLWDEFYEDDYQEELEREASIRWEKEQSNREEDDYDVEEGDDYEVDILTTLPGIVLHSSSRSLNLPPAVDSRDGSCASLDIATRQAVSNNQKLNTQISVSSIGSCSSADSHVAAAVFFPPRGGALQRMENRLSADSAARLRAVNETIERTLSSKSLVSPANPAAEAAIPLQRVMSIRTLTKINTNRNKGIANSTTFRRVVSGDRRTHMAKAQSSASLLTSKKSLQDFIEEYESIVNQ